MKKELYELERDGFIPVHAIDEIMWKSLTVEQQEIVLTRYTTHHACRRGRNGEVRVLETDEYAIFLVR